jgi:flavin-dependent dehydrogenase
MKRVVVYALVVALGTALATSFDVVVYGATPGGVMAAVAAGREGRTVTLLAPGEYIGGATTGGLMRADYGMHAARVIGGQTEEFYRRAAEKYATKFSFPPDGQCGAHTVPWTCEPHVAEDVFLDMLISANVTTLHHSRVTAANVLTPVVGFKGTF